MKVFLTVVTFVVFVMQASAAELVQAVRLVVDDVTEWSANAFEVYREDEPNRTPGPFFVDVASLRVAARQGAGTDLARTDLANAIGRTYRNATVKEVVRSRPSPDTSRAPNFWVVNDGVHLQFDSVTKTVDGYRIVVSYRLTERRLPGRYRRTASSAIASSKVRYTVSQERGRWVIKEREVLFTT